MKRAFTLVELMIVVGLMAMMSVLALGSYSAITRGMKDRAAIDTARTLADAALQRAKLDRTPTYVYLFNEVSKLDSEMSAGVVYGVAVAVRPVGRISAVPESGFFCDEFADLNDTYGALEEDDDQASQAEKEKSATTFFRLYNIAERSFATVQEGVFAHTIRDRDLEATSEETTYRTWTVHGFRKASGDSGSASFKVGDEYGQEFLVTRLPPGYTFSSSVSMNGTSSLGRKQVGEVLKINPTDSSSPSIQIYARRPSGRFDSIGGTGNAKDAEQ